MFTVYGHFILSSIVTGEWVQTDNSMIVLVVGQCQHQNTATSQKRSICQVAYLKDTIFFMEKCSLEVKFQSVGQKYRSQRATTEQQKAVPVNFYQPNVDKSGILRTNFKTQYSNSKGRSTAPHRTCKTEKKIVNEIKYQ
jgi:hypothetical protein